MNRPWRAEAAWWSACLVLAASFVLLVAYLFGNPLFYAGAIIPPAATTSIAFAALGTALLALAMRQAAAEGTARFTGRIPYPLVLVFVLLAAGIVTVGGLYLRFEARRYRAAIERQLSAVAELKTAELVRWREQRVADANVFRDNAAFSSNRQGGRLRRARWALWLKVAIDRRFVHRLQRLGHGLPPAS